MKNNPIPGDQANWSVYGKLHQENQRYLWGILLDAAKSDPTRTPTQQKIGDYFDACMDVDAVEKAGSTPLAADLARIDAMKSVKELAPILGSIHARVPSSAIMFGNGVEQDAKESTQQIFAIYAGVWASRSRLLLEGRRQVEDTRAVRRARREDAQLLGDDRAGRGLRP
jgi:endothelin-converting enzyme/putative endopeptidase